MNKITPEITCSHKCFKPQLLPEKTNWLNNPPPPPTSVVGAKKNAYLVNMKLNFFDLQIPYITKIFKSKKFRLVPEKFHKHTLKGKTSWDFLFESSCFAEQKLLKKNGGSVFNRNVLISWYQFDWQKTLLSITILQWDLFWRKNCRCEAKFV